MPYVDRTYYCSICNNGHDSYREAEMCELKDRGIVDKLKEIVRLVEEFNKLSKEEKIRIGGYLSNYSTCVSTTLCDVEKAENEDKNLFFKEVRTLLLDKETTLLLDKAYKEIKEKEK